MKKPRLTIFVRDGKSHHIFLVIPVLFYLKQRFWCEFYFAQSAANAKFNGNDMLLFSYRCGILCETMLLRKPKKR